MKLQQCERCGKQTAEGLTLCPECMKAAGASAEEVTAAEELRDGIVKRQPDWQAAVVEDESKLGGGALPTSPLPTFAVALQAPGLSAEQLARALRRADPPVIGRIRDDRVLLDVRTILPGESADVVRAVESILP